MTDAEKRFHMLGKMLLHNIVQEPLRLLDMNRADTKNMFFPVTMRQKLAELPQEQFDLFRDVFTHLAVDAAENLLGFLVHEEGASGEERQGFAFSSEPGDNHSADAVIDGQPVVFPPEGCFTDIWMDKWQQEEGVHPTAKEVWVKYREQDIENRPEGVSYGDTSPNAPRVAMEKFGKLVIETFKDNTVRAFEWYLTDYGAADQSRVLSAKIKDLPDETKDALRDCVIESAMTGVHDFLFGLEEAQNFGEGIDLTVDGIDIVSASDGLNYEIFGEDGFDAKFSQYPTGEDIEEKYKEEIKALKRSERKSKK